MKNKTFGIIGAGSWGTALVKIFSENLDTLNWYIRNKEIINGIQENNRNPKYLRYVKLKNKKLLIFQKKMVKLIITALSRTSVLIDLKREKKLQPNLKI